MTMPDVTKVQVLAVAQAVVAAAVAFGAPLSQHQQDSLLALAAIVAAILIPADVVIRGNRAKHIASKLTPAPKPVPPTFTSGTGPPTKSYSVTGTTGYAVADVQKAQVTAKPAAKKKPGPKKKP